MEDVVTRQHAHPNVVLHCLYAYYIHRYTKKELARVFSKTERTISNWIRVYERTGTFGRFRGSIATKFNQDHRAWLGAFYDKQPMSYIDEAQAAFKKAFHMDISRSTVWRIIHELGLTWKMLERRAMHIKERDIFRFVEELSAIDWAHCNLIFLNEVSFDNRGMLRRRGFAPKGESFAVRGDFQWKPRISILAFIGVQGLLGFYDTEGTFDRVKFVTYCREFAYSKSGGVRQYPGKNSVWILNIASIHRDPEIIHFLRGIGIVPIFLPAYCPFFNPIEFFFGYVKRSFKRHYDETSGRDLLPFVFKTLLEFEHYNMARVFEHCGWKVTIRSYGPHVDREAKST